MRTMAPVSFFFLLLISIVGVAPLAGGGMTYSEIIESPTQLESPVPLPSLEKKFNLRVKILVVRNTRVNWFEEKVIKVSLDGQPLGEGSDWSQVKEGNRNYDQITFYGFLPGGDHRLEAHFKVRLRGYDWGGSAVWEKVSTPDHGKVVELKAFAKIKKELFQSSIYLDRREPSLLELNGIKK